jgi:hypothetical protein
MMDIICINCGEPWSIDYVLHDAPDEFERTGGVIKKCPCCPKDKKPVLDEKTKMKLEAVEVLGEILGDDIDGLACEIEDLGLV